METNPEPIVDPVVDPVVDPTPKEPTPTPKEPRALSPEELDLQKKSFGYAFNMVDQKLAEAGYIKPEGVKTTDYLLQILSESKKETSTGTKPPTESVNQESTDKIKALQTKLIEKEKELESILASTTTQKRDYFVDSSISGFEIDAPAHLSDPEKERYIARNKKLIKTELLDTYDFKEVNGSFQAYNKDGSLVLDNTIDMNPIKVSDILKKDFSEYLPKQKETPKPVIGTGGIKSEKVEISGVTLPSNVKNADELITHLTKTMGMTLGSEPMLKVVNAAKEKHPSWFNTK